MTFNEPEQLTLALGFVDSNGRNPTEMLLTLPASNAVMTHLELRSGLSPIVRVPFTIHGKGYHTFCGTRRIFMNKRKGWVGTNVVGRLG